MEEQFLQFLQNSYFPENGDTDQNRNIVDPINTFQASPEFKKRLKKERKSISDIRQYDNGTFQYDITESTGKFDFDDSFKAFNSLAQITTGLANANRDAKNRRLEEKYYLDSLIPKASYNYNEDGLNNIPMYQNGGIPERYKNMGFSKVGVKKQSTRPGKKWMVLAKKGDDYKVVHGGDKSMQDYTQHGSEKRRENFWNRMGGKNSEKASDPFSPLYWHKKFGTWQNGGRNTIYTDNPNDPRIAKYNDSLAIYNFYKTTEPKTYQYYFDGHYDKRRKQDWSESYKNDEIQPVGHYFLGDDGNGNSHYQAVYKKPVQPIQYAPSYKSSGNWRVEDGMWTRAKKKFRDGGWHHNVDNIPFPGDDNEYSFDLLRVDRNQKYIPYQQSFNTQSQPQIVNESIPQSSTSEQTKGTILPDIVKDIVKPKEEAALERSNREYAEIAQKAIDRDNAKKAALQKSNLEYSKIAEDTLEMYKRQKDSMESRKIREDLINTNRVQLELATKNPALLEEVRKNHPSEYDVFMKSGILPESLKKLFNTLPNHKFMTGGINLEDELELSPADIERLQNLGYKIEILD